MGNLINMEALSEEERAVILNVLRRDESLRKSENKKIGQLRLEIQTIRMKSVLRDGDDLSKICARCHAELGFLFNRGDMCPICHFKVCKLCQETLLIGKWLCSLCYKQRQLRWLQQGGMDSGPGGTLKRWPSGTELVKASIRKTLVIADPGTESDPGTERGLKQNGATIRNGSVYKDKAQQEPERIECPKDSDKRKLTQLFDTFKMPKKTESAEKKHLQTSVRRATSRRYGTDTESSSSSDEEMTSSLPASMLTSTSVQSSPAPSRVSGNDTTASEFEEIHVSDSVLHKTSESVNSSPRKSLQRKHSYDSDQTIHSDDAPFSKSSTETQIRVEVHSDASSTKSADICRPKTSPSKSASSNSQNSYKVKQSGHEGVKVTRKESSSSQRSSSPEMGGMRHVQVSRQCILQPGRSPSPYSFDSIPSSHANSPLPRQRILDQTADYPLQKNSSEDTDSLSRYSANEYSGTESSGHIRDGSSGADELMMDDVSKMKFHKLSKKVDTSKSKSPAHSPNTKKDVAPKLSPRASSEGSGSLEDSGHVSGTSTQDNTPEHRRTDSIQSQMSVPSTLSTVTDVSNKEDDCEVDIDELVASHKASTQSSFGSSHGNLLSTVADSRESIASFYSDAGGVNYGKVPVTGEIQFGIDYNYRTGTLEIAIRQCKELAPADPKRHRSDPYVKTYLLPDKTRGGKRKTRVKKNTLGPIFDETLRYLISKSEVENRILWVTVWHNDRFGRNDFLGEVSINFDYFRFGNSAPKWYPLQERVETQTTSLLTYQGDLILSLRLVSKDNVKEILTSPTKTKRKKVRPDGSSGCQLQVLLKEARNLTAVRSNGYSDPFCKGYLLPDKHKGLKQKTPVIKRECSPKWNYTFIFDDVSPEELKERALELTIWDHDKISSNDFLGGVRLNLGLGRSFGRIVDWNDAKGEEISMWQAMLDRPDSWIDGTLILRPNMDKRRY